MSNERDIMNSSDGAQKLILTYDAPFLNSDCLFVEYDDVIESPFFILLNCLKDNEGMRLIFDLSEISSMNIEELYEWYIMRKEKNILLNLPLIDGVLEYYFNNDEDNFKEWCESLLYDEIDNIDGLLEIKAEANFSTILKTLLSKNVVKKTYIYSNKYSKNLEEELKEEFGSNIIYVSGDIKKIIEDNNITNNSTFVFSDIMNVLKLKEAGILEYSSIIIADRYGYNYKNDSNDVIIDIESLLSESVFKLDFFNNIESEEDAEEEE